MPNSPDDSTGIPIKGQRVSDSDAIAISIKARASEADARRENKALRRERDDLLREFTDYRNARHQPPVQKPPLKSRKGKAKVRITVGDLHGQRMHRPAVDAFLHDLAEWKPDEILLGGDMVEAGGWISKKQPIGFQAAVDYSYQEDIAAANWFLDEVQKRAPRATIKFIEGNHCDKVERLLMDVVATHGGDHQFMMDLVSPRALLRLKERGIEYYGRHEVHEEGMPRGWVKWGKCYYVHELGGGKNAARTSLLKTAANVVYFHTHREDTASIVFPGVGLVKAWNSGCLCGTDPVWMHSNPTEWTWGYGVEFIEPNDDFLRIHVPIWEGRSFAGTLMRKMRR